MQISILYCFICNPVLFTAWYGIQYYLLLGMEFSIIYCFICNVVGEEERLPSLVS